MLCYLRIMINVIDSESERMTYYIAANLTSFISKISITFIPLGNALTVKSVPISKFNPACCKIGYIYMIEFTTITITVTLMSVMTLFISLLSNIPQRLMIVSFRSGTRSNQKLHPHLSTCSRRVSNEYFRAV